MNMEIIKTVLLFAGGLGLFLYGMELMAEGLQKAAGDKTRRLLEALTKNPVMGLFAGALVTAIIQSSSATTVLVVGFVNASLMSLGQACSVIMGANIGTTMTGWIVSMGEWASFLKPEMIAPLLLVAGVIVNMMAKSERIKDGSKILIGFGILFSGLSTMSGSISPYADSPLFTQIFEVLGANPVLGILAGAAVTAVIQSSSASMGILQTMAMAGIVNWGSAIFIALGQNIGTCVTALISSISGDTNARRAAMIHLEFNVLGALIVGTAAVCWFMVFPSMMSARISSSGLALFHTGFNLAVTLILFPFRNRLVSLSKVLIAGSEKKKEKHSADVLDYRLRTLPDAAIGVLEERLGFLKTQCSRVIALSKDVLLDHHDLSRLSKEARDVMDECIRIREFCSQAAADPQALTSHELRALQRILFSARDLHQIAALSLSVGQLQSDLHEPVQADPVMKGELESLCGRCAAALEKLNTVQKESSHEALLDSLKMDAARIRQTVVEMRTRFLEESEKGSKKAESDWLFFDAADEYEQMIFRILRLANEDAWIRPLPRTDSLSHAASAEDPVKNHDLPVSLMQSAMQVSQ